MGHESQIELWSPNLTTFSFVGFGTDRLRRQEAMKTADRENPIHGVTWPRHRAHGAVGQNRTRSIEWAEKQEKFQPQEKCFFLTSAFIELIGILIRKRTQQNGIGDAEDGGACANAQGNGECGSDREDRTFPQCSTCECQIL
jgi:hypothetical protein